MAREKTPSFIHTLSLAPELWQANIITNRFEAGRALYNACLGELLKRHTLMIESKRFRAAIKAYRIAKKEGDKKKLKELSVALLIICVEFGFTEYSIHIFVSSYRHSQFENLTDAHTS